MNLIYFKSDIGNFGDDLNPWLWKKLLGDFSSYPTDIDFAGIGSILDDRVFSENKEYKKIIFGSGVRDFSFNLPINEKIDIRFVRGPISSKVCNNAPYITDSAYALALLTFPEQKKKYKVSYIPYFRNYHNFDWQLFKKLLGVNVINPCDDIENVIKEIRSSEKILTSAMHGAIFADIFRIPWMRVKMTKSGYESDFTSELKWTDWLLSMNIQNCPTHYLDFDLNKKAKNKIDTILKIIKFKLKFRSNRFITSNNDIFENKVVLIKEEIEKIKVSDL